MPTRTLMKFKKKVIVDFKLKFNNDRRGGKKWEKKNFFYKSHGKQHGGHKGKQINPLTVQRNA